MEIILGKTAGFCYGVKRAVEGAKEELKKKKNLYCLGEVVHNGQVLKSLEKEGMTFIEKKEEAKKDVVIRAHGIPKEIYEYFDKNNVNVIDYTCPNVLKIHNIAKEHSKLGYYIFLTGSKKHPENIGTISYCGNNYSVIEDLEDIEEALTKLNKSKIKKLLLISQTTFSLEKFNIIKEKINESIDKNIVVEVKNTICMATKVRQEETSKISKNVDCMIIIGGKNSSNTKKLYEIAKKDCKFVMSIEDEERFR